MGARFANLILDVRDLDRSVDFYHGLLRIPLGDRRCVFGHHLAQLGIGGPTILLVQQPVAEQPPDLVRSGGSVLKFYVDDVARLADDLRNHEVPILQPLDAPTESERTILVADPDGYPVLLAESLGLAA